MPLNYLNDPGTELLIWGDELAKGMVILLEDAFYRGDPNKYETSDERDRHHILMTARWCRVTAIRRNDDLITFFGEYSDRSEFKRSYNSSFAWYVKKASMPN